jgi:hypothetical protein
MFGQMCKKPSCPFIHPNKLEFPAHNQLKWIAPSLESSSNNNNATTTTTNNNNTSMTQPQTTASS